MHAEDPVRFAAEQAVEKSTAAGAALGALFAAEQAVEKSVVLGLRFILQFAAEQAVEKSRGMARR